MTIDVHFYSISRDIAGQPARQIAVPEGSTLADALDVLFREVPALADIRGACLYAVGTSYATMKRALAAGEVISIIPPMQGG
ncbi:MAG: MoaD/ThiS family protein [Bacteroidota bacterium]|nr:MoaD/ThiS family protein [Bacteroidota bacterium]MDP4232253.1 MoaD/ThiS family protein [Bacteroidota bacterium]MDP4242655.1 MoaD/ThiS family protein [Bacteroidota bacterium]MDP4286783.1 MoaD/ThiS family protein [Bacteroidota bacterium]